MKNRSRALSAAMCALSCAMIIAGSFIKIPVTPLAITLQVEFVLLSSLLFGARKSCAAVGTYIFLGLCGIPVFSQGGGLSYVLNPSFGFLIGFLLATVVTGALSVCVKKQTFGSYYANCLVGLAVIYVIGVVYFWLISRFYLNTDISFMQLIGTCVLVTLPADVILCVPVALCAKRLVPSVKKYIL